MARVKEQMDLLHAGFSRVDGDGRDCLRQFGELIEQRRVKAFSEATIKLVAVLPLETEYLSHLEKISLVLSEYVVCMREIEEKREELLQQRATLMGLTPPPGQPHQLHASVPAPSSHQ